jgi:hypothetical protein
MRFMVIRKADAETEAGMLPSEKLIADMTAYNEKMVKAGVMQAGEGLAPSSQGARVKFRGGKPTIIDGPFAEAKELIAGFSILEAASLAEVLDWVRQWPQEDGHGEVEVEIRRILTAEDFGAAFTHELQQKDAALRAESAARLKP